MIFLIGSQKSGTTWLRDCFAHVCPVPRSQEWYFVEFYEQIARHIVQYGHLDQDQQAATRRRVIGAAWRELLDAVTPGAVFDKSAYPCTSAIGPLRNDLHPLAVRLAREIFPEARTIVIVRDPRAALNSAIHYVNHFRPGAGDGIDAAEFGATWRHQNTCWLADQPTVVLRYEDLKLDFAGSLARTFAALDLPHDRDTITRIEQAEFDIDRIRARQPEIYRRGIIDEYKDRLAPEILKRLETEAAPLMAQLGYTPAAG